MCISTSHPSHSRIWLRLSDLPHTPHPGSRSSSSRHAVRGRASSVTPSSSRSRICPDPEAAITEPTMPSLNTDARLPIQSLATNGLGGEAMVVVVVVVEEEAAPATGSASEAVAAVAAAAAEAPATGNTDLGFFSTGAARGAAEECAGHLSATAAAGVLVTRKPWRCAMGLSAQDTCTRILQLSQPSVWPRLLLHSAQGSGATSKSGASAGGNSTKRPVSRLSPTKAGR
jgi:hypothetical protein